MSAGDARTRGTTGHDRAHTTGPESSRPTEPTRTVRRTPLPACSRSCRLPWRPKGESPACFLCSSAFVYDRLMTGSSKSQVSSVMKTVASDLV